MSLALSQLIPAQPASAWLSRLLGALQGLGFVVPTGTGTGSLSLSGVPTSSQDVVITVSVAGELGTGQFSYQLTDQNGVVTSAGPFLIPGGGSVAIPGTGAVVIFAPGPSGAGTSFQLGDTFSFPLTTPVFPATSWQAGSVPRTFLEMYAAALADGDEAIASVAAGGLLDYVSTIGKLGDAWADLLAANAYGLTRKTSIATQGTIVLTAPAGVGPFTISTSQLWVASTTGLRYNNTGGGTLNPGSSLSLTWQAETPGAAYNVANNAINTLVTVLPGVTVNNPDPGSGSWITVSGTDAESTSSLVTRCKQRWPGLGGGATADVYAFWAVTAAAEVTRARVITDLVIPGQVDVYLAGSSGAVSGPTVAAVGAYIAARTPLTSTVSVVSATNQAVAVTGTIYVRAAQLAAAQAQAIAALQAYFTTLAIGGEQIGAGPAKGVSLEKIIGALVDVNGVVDATLTLPATDTALTSTQVATLTTTLTWVAV